MQDKIIFQKIFNPEPVTENIAQTFYIKNYGPQISTKNVSVIVFRAHGNKTEMKYRYL